jgi:hypothetical protein
VRILRLAGVHEVMEAEKRLRQAGVRAELAPLPPDLSRDCGVCLEIADDDEPAARAALEGLDLEVVPRP